jgi:hypothetical protein
LLHLGCYTKAKRARLDVSPFPPLLFGRLRKRFSRLKTKFSIAKAHFSDRKRLWQAVSRRSKKNRGVTDMHSAILPSGAGMFLHAPFHAQIPAAHDPGEKNADAG